MATVEVDNLTKQFGRGRLLSRLASRSARRAGVSALADVTFSLDAGDVAAITGHNGAGKSTLLRVLATLLLPTHGTARIAGYDTAHDDIEVRRRVALVTADDRSFSLRLTARENLRFFAALHGLRGADREAAVDAALERVALADEADTVYAAFSSGMRQRLALARGMTVAAPVLLLDEPFRALDDESCARLRALIAEAATVDGATVLVATHNLDELAGMWTRVLRLDHGCLAADDRVSVLAP